MALSEEVLDPSLIQDLAGSDRFPVVFFPSVDVFANICLVNLTSH